MGDECKLGEFLCTLRKQGWGKYIFRIKYLYWIYSANNLGNICQLNIYVGIGYIKPTVGGLNVSRVHGSGIYAANNLGNICQLNIYVGIGYVAVGYSSLGMIVGAFGGRVGEYTLLKIWIYAANNLGNKCCYWIYHANSWGMNVGWVVFVRPSGLGIHFSKYIFVLEITTIANQEIMTHHYL